MNIRLEAWSANVRKVKGERGEFFMRTLLCVDKPGGVQEFVELDLSEPDWNAHVGAAVEGTTLNGKDGKELRGRSVEFNVTRLTASDKYGIRMAGNMLSMK